MSNVLPLPGGKPSSPLIGVLSDKPTDDGRVDACARDTFSLPLPLPLGAISSPQTDPVSQFLRDPEKRVSPACHDTFPMRFFSLDEPPKADAGKRGRDSSNNDQAGLNQCPLKKRKDLTDELDVPNDPLAEQRKAILTWIRGFQTSDVLSATLTEEPRSFPSFIEKENPNADRIEIAERKALSKI